MKLNNKGFVVSTLMYALLIVFLFLIIGIITLLSNRKMILDKLKKDVKEDVNGMIKYQYYPNGTAIYYNPVTNKICSDYEEENSLNENKTGCMKWYIFNDNINSNKVNMILDHNTTYHIAYNSTGSNTEPKEAQDELDALVNNSQWKVTPRFITADEVAHIVGADREDTIKWNSKKVLGTNDIETNSSWIYFDGEGVTYSEWQRQVANSTNKSKYSWLYSHLNQCTTYGANDADVSSHGYWVKNAVNTADYNTLVWYVDKIGSLDYDHWRYIGASEARYYGVRPVITIDKNMLAKSITVTFDANGGNIDIDKKLVNVGNTYGELPTPTRKGYVFKGWNGKNLFNIENTIPSKYTNVDGDKIILDSSAVSENVANWVELKLFKDNNFVRGFSKEFVKDETINTMNFKMNTTKQDASWQYFLNDLKNNNQYVFSYSVYEKDYSHARLVINKVQIEEGNTSTEYEPYYIEDDTKVIQDKNHTLKAIWDIDWDYVPDEYKNVPDEYQKVEYIESTGTQHIDTGVKASNKTVVYAELFTLQEANKNWFGGSAYTNHNFIFNSWNNNKIEYEYGLNSGWYTPSSNDNLINEKFTIRYGDGEISINNKIITYLPTESFNDDSNIYIFTRNGNAGNYNTYVQGRIYSFKIYESGKLVRNYIPCYKKSDNTIGLYETMEGKFYTNKGTGTFNKGNNI